MALSTRYVSKETLASLRRNRLMTVAAILTVAVSLSLVGVALLLQQGVSNATVRWSNGVNVAVFLQASATPAETLAAHQQLMSMPEVKRCYYMDKKESYQQMRQLYANQPDVYQSVTINEVPPAYRCVLTNANDAVMVGQALQGEPGVRNVVYPGQEITTMRKVSFVVQVIFMSLAAVLFLSALVLVANTIRLAIFARRREVAVMKLVGATNWFIRVPFMMEGLVQGLAGGLVALGAIVLLHWGFESTIGHAGAQNIFQALVIPTSSTILIGVLVAVIGAVMGALSSLLAIRRFLAV